MNSEIDPRPKSLQDPVVAEIVSPLGQISENTPSVSATSEICPPGESADHLPRFEKLKFYTDLYKFYSELPFKILAAYAVASTLILAVTANLTKNSTVVAWLNVFVVALGVFIGIKFAVIDKKYLEPHRDEVESLVKELGLSFGPNFHVMRFILRISVVSFVLLPLVAGLLFHIFIMTR
jgi:hypothetical protein